MLHHVQQVLQQLLEAHQDLLKLANQKRLKLVEADVEQLQHIQKEESDVIKRISAIEAQRVQAVDQLLRTNGISRRAEETTLTMLVELLSCAKSRRSIEGSEALFSVGDQLQRVIQEVQSVNALNQQLIEDALSYAQTTLDYMTEPQSPTYHKPTSNQSGSQVQVASSPTQSFFDTKA
ncbi:flagellar export chaperone FlgN [Caldalkalibacillus salinus]|uniref:flagellar export chaperone FlgN n=1 Tax=Caldalkalibacillus salinus TaxID=2803787 RepID=UPI00192202B3